MKDKSIICWWSGGVTSAVACKKAIEMYGHSNCKVIMLDTKNEHADTYRFLEDCSRWYGIEIEVLSHVGTKYESIKDTWYKYNSLNTANGAICSSLLKRKVREDWEKTNEWSHQVFGFEFETKEFKRALSFTMNHEYTKPIYPLLMLGMNKKDCIKYVEDVGIKLPDAYLMGFNNNNCLNTGCVQGGIGYWQKIHKDLPHLYEKMAKVEHELTDLKGSPVTMLKDQSKESIALALANGLKRKYAPLFLRSHPTYPDYKTVLDKTARAVEPLMECSGFCGVNDLLPNSKTQDELNLI